MRIQGLVLISHMHLLRDAVLRSLKEEQAALLQNFQRLSPGPDAYNLQISLLYKHDFNRGESRMFRLPVAVKREKPKNENPAPNQYDVSYSGVDKNSTVSAQSAFRSKTRRSASVSDNFKGPSPCHYNVSDASLQKMPQVPYSCFKSTTSRIQSPVRNNIPGPGTYNPYEPPEPVKRTVLPRRHYLGLSAPPLIPTKDPPFPGPGHYDIVNYSRPVKHLVSSAAFLSGTSRWIQDVKGQDMPGPGFYEPMVLTKTSFLYNPAKMWIPA
ncbi:O(6)-methylguanine-induced apoptosis 2-like isoform X2 [Sinocyclocheilus rhinocerous]|uniref:O(6)-methylguanine-induced apoptosis 2-like isoform X2 n=1 Tax=Sinocyclocheilus rhinocerous TaxID=307959 RepID=UPI0007BA9156|nr:PREDICTED: O(6)-methylguanine-induced apoptosis 2-like isoform X2 [Sinocyclocheilus rhinocerous]